MLVMCHLQNEQAGKIILLQMVRKEVQYVSELVFSLCRKL